MAKRRMFSLDVVDTDAFLDLPLTTQALYFHLGMRADDDGFVASPKRLMAMVGCAADDMRVLVAKGYIIPFDSGVCVVRDWKINNHIQKDRYHETLYKAEKMSLQQGESGSYFLMDTSCIQDGYILDTELRLGKTSQEKISVGEVNTADKPPRAPRFSPPSVDEVREYCLVKGYGVNADQFIDFYTANGWVQGKGKPIKDWKAAVRTWQRRDDAKSSKASEEQDYRWGWD